MEDRFTIVMDIDGTICPIKKPEEDYAELEPYPEMVERMRQLRREKNAYIVLLTSRQMRTFGGNIGKINANTAPVLLEWLKKWDIPYDEIIYGKPWAGENGVYVDDRAVRPDEFLNYATETMEILCAASRPKRRKEE